MLVSLCACSGEKTEESLSEKSVSSEAEPEKEKSEASSVRAVSSSLTSPLALQEWGNAAKFSTLDQKYYTVPVRILKVITGSQAEKTVRDYTKENKTYSLPSDDSSDVWVTAEYEICLDGFPAGKSGTDAGIVSFVTGLDGNTLEYSGKKYSVTTINITDGKYYYEGVHRGSIAFTIPSGCRDYMLSLGEYGETQAFFTQSTKNTLSLE